MKQTLLHNRHLHTFAALIAADLVVFTAVDPSKASALWLITGYVLLGMTVFALASSIAGAFKQYGTRAHSLSTRFLRYGAAIVVVLVGLQSVGQLTVKDVATLLPLALLAYLYLGYGKKAAPE